MGNGKDLLEEYNLSEVRKRMMQLSEYSFKTGIVEDDDDNQQQQPPMNGGQQMPTGGQQGGAMPQQGQQMGSQPDMGQGQMDNMNQGGMPQGDMGGQQMPMDGGQMPMDNSQMDAQPADTGEMPPMDMGMPQGGDEQAPDADIPDEDTDMEGGDDDEEVIDVDDLTNSQEATEYKIDGVNDKITALLQVTSKFADAREDNEKQLQDLRRELERRNPTPEEKMNIRSQASYPYGESPRDYWDRKSAQNPNYEVIYNNDVAPQDEDKEFEIKRDDLENIDTKSLSDSLEFPKELRDYLDF